MSPTKDSSVKTVRVKNGTIAQIMNRADRRGWTFNKWMNWAILQGLRKHTKKDGSLTTE